MQVYQKIFCDFGMWESKLTATPMDTSKLKSFEKIYKCSNPNEKWYAKFIGLLMYVMLKTWVDTAFSIFMLSWHLANLRFAHIKAAIKIICYLKKINRMELAFWRNWKPLMKYTDANWAQDIATQRFISRFFFNIKSSTISWSLS